MAVRFGQKSAVMSNRMCDALIEYDSALRAVGDSDTITVPVGEHGDGEAQTFTLGSTIGREFRPVFDAESCLDDLDVVHDVLKRAARLG
ncbi:hypothetical protein [Galbitalea soli]|uniref:Uncharacterized protein n=1 Tax=Galbitalea soli TaxID=1268042 RepID=A0A7C9PLL3_9MICO|nr:hypothetical protein [Galbitalea soli]NEM90334.1 hypothetical protein [Galbitalea soli]NYJ31043.1 hypothetical protein [Galbitalea soli]